MGKLSIRQRSVIILLFAWLAYTLSYIGRVNYNSCILEIVSETGIARASAGLVASVFSIFYAVGQLTIGLFIKRVSTVKIIGIELVSAALINLLFPMSIGKWYAFLLWGLNGFIQSCVLCTITQIFAENLKEPYLSRSAVVVNTVGAVGGALNYVLTWFLLTYSRWQTVFYAAATLLLAFALIWIFVMPRVTVKASWDTQNEDKGTEVFSSETPQNSFLATLKEIFIDYIPLGAPIAILCCFFVGILRDGVSVWIPSFINDSFALSTEDSIFSTIFVPVFQVFGAFIGGWIGKRVKNLHIPASLIFFLSCFCMFSLSFFGDIFLPLTLSLFIINAMSITAALTLYLNLFPLRVFGVGGVAIVVGISNFCNHSGDFTAATGIGWLSERTDWKFTFIVLGLTALLSAVLAAIGGIKYFKGSKMNVQTYV